MYKYDLNSNPKTSLFLCLFLCTGVFFNAETTKAQTENRKAARILFYNTENLFYPENDSLKRDDDFTPEGMKHWTMWRYRQKLHNIYKIITATGKGDLPEIIGLCEIESAKCLKDLINQTPLLLYAYDYIHYESPDSRGIDVALLYRTDRFQVISSKAIHIHFPEHISTRSTRDILYTKGILNKKDTLHLFINHWPSKYSGAKASEPLRYYVAQKLKQHTDSILQINPKAAIVLTGDFNDHPLEKSITEGLQAQNNLNTPVDTGLYNLSYPLQFNQRLWTHKHHDHTEVIDQFIVSGNLINQQVRMHTASSYCRIFSSEFILMQDKKYLGLKTFRTYLGMKYIGGFSDHLPVYLDLFRK